MPFLSPCPQARRGTFSELSSSASCQEARRSPPRRTPRRSSARLVDEETEKPEAAGWASGLPGGRGVHLVAAKVLATRAGAEVLALHGAGNPAHAALESSSKENIRMRLL